LDEVGALEEPLVRLGSRALTRDPEGIFGLFLPIYYSFRRNFALQSGLWEVTAIRKGTSYLLNGEWGVRRMPLCCLDPTLSY
jgi:hypothetical protein